MFSFPRNVIIYDMNNEVVYNKPKREQIDISLFPPLLPIQSHSIFLSVQVNYPTLTR